MSIKENVAKNLKRAAEDLAAAQPAPADLPVEDEKLVIAQAKVARGELKAARRTSNGALVETH